MIKNDKKRNYTDQQKKQQKQSKLLKQKKQKIAEEYEDQYQVEILSESRWIGRDEY